MLVGPSGCGKSTTLRMIAGLETISEGELYIGDHVVNDVAPKNRDIAMVFQSYALYPHMTVYKNMAFALELRKTPKAEIDLYFDILGSQKIARIPSRIPAGVDMDIRLAIDTDKVHVFDKDTEKAICH